jgi:hypothetical protein
MIMMVVLVAVMSGHGGGGGEWWRVLAVKIVLFVMVFVATCVA